MQELSIFSQVIFYVLVVLLGIYVLLVWGRVQAAHLIHSEWLDCSNPYAETEGTYVTTKKARDWSPSISYSESWAQRKPGLTSHSLYVASGWNQVR